MRAIRLWYHGSMARQVINIAHWSFKHNLFLRIGRNFGCSKCGLDNEWRRETGKISEGGTSVYFVHKHEDGYMIGQPSQERACYGLGDYFHHMFTDVLLDPICSGEIYFVRGRLIPVRDNSDKAWDYAYNTVKDDAYERASDRAEAFAVKFGLSEDEASDLRYSTCKTAVESAKRADIRVWTYDTGSDGEPLLQAGSARIIKTLSMSDFLSLYLNYNFKVGNLTKYGKTIPELCNDRSEEDEEEED